MWTIGLDNVSLDEAVSSACEILANGGLVVYPTETVYGIAADAGNAEAVSRLLAFKNRPAGKAISLLVSDETAAEQVVSLNETARQLYRKFLPGPLSVVSVSRHLVDSRLESELGSLAIRISSYPFAAAMAEGVKHVSGADISLAITGVAGPGGGSEEKPVGTVFIAVCSPSGLVVKKRHFPGERHHVQTLAAYVGLQLVREACTPLSGQSSAKLPE